MSSPSQGYEYTSTVRECNSVSQTSQHSISHRILNTHNNPTYTISLLPSLHNPRESTPFSATQSLRISTSFQGSSASSQEYSCWDSQDSQLWEKLNTCQRISYMQELIHGWNTPTIITTNKTMAHLQQFVFLSQAKIKMIEE
jgi:hypothetical protein